MGLAWQFPAQGPANPSGRTRRPFSGAISMNATFFPSVEMWRLAEGVLEGSLQEMSNDGVHGNEGVVLWLGRRIQGQAEITHLVGLRGSGVTKRPDFLVISPWLLNEVADVALQLSVSLIGQIHTHGSGYGLDLSRTDRTQGIAVPHFLSVVAPDYGLRSDISITDCGVHVFEPGLGYRRLSMREVEQRVQVVPGPPPPLLLIGRD